MSEHTPGPWVVFTIASSAGRSFRIYAPPSDDKVEAIDIAHIPKDWESEANARLIAAAPEMLATAKEIDRFLLVIECAVRSADPSQHRAVLDALMANRAAIRKAEGTDTEKREDVG
jgi:hypothetical protein